MTSTLERGDAAPTASSPSDSSPEPGRTAEVPEPIDQADGDSIAVPAGS